jgi:hypothetical protein
VMEKVATNVVFDKPDGDGRITYDKNRGRQVMRMCERMT